MYRKTIWRIKNTTTYLKRGYRRLMEYAVKLASYPYYLSNRKDHILLTVSLPVFKTSQTNWGDDVSLVLVEHLSGKPVIPYNRVLPSKPNFACIGSILTSRIDGKSIVWGSGAIASTHKMKHTPAKVLAVRGPLTRAYLTKQCIDCPEIFGDPALLFPYLYNPPIPQKKYRLGIICHHLELTDRKLIDRLNTFPDCLLIDIVNYGKWTGFIDQLYACNFIISSSLHGLIVADAYRVPNYWFCFSGKLVDDGFKFKDYFLSVNKPEITQPVFFDEAMSYEQILAYQQKWQPAKIDLRPLVEACPFLQDGSPLLAEKLMLE
jgi:Polysaccharide pyruvyl transferase.